MVINSVIPSANPSLFSKQTVEGIATGLTDFTLSQLLVLQKLRIQGRLAYERAPQATLSCRQRP